MMPCSHYPNNTHRYTDEAFYWEIVLTARKVGIVAISVFGRVIGTQRQAQVALLILFLCISLEIAARPYKIVTKRHKVLGRLELATLFSLWGTMWCGTLIFASQSPGDEGFVVFLSLLVACINIGILLWLLYRLAAECLFENKDSKAGRVVMRRMGSLRKQASWRRASGAKKVDTAGVQIELTASAGANPLYRGDGSNENQKGGSNNGNSSNTNNNRDSPTTKTKAQRSVVAAVEPEAVESEVVSNPVLRVSNSSEGWVRSFDASTGYYYLSNEATGESKWEVSEGVEKKEEEEEGEAERFSLFYTDEGNKYFVPELGGENLWVLPEGAELVHER
jgi:hypothetical protein